jgi:hypothetical protein
MQWVMSLLGGLGLTMLGWSAWVLYPENKYYAQIAWVIGWILTLGSIIGSFAWWSIKKRNKKKSNFEFVHEWWDSKITDWDSIYAELGQPLGDNPMIAYSGDVGAVFRRDVDRHSVRMSIGA